MSALLSVRSVSKQYGSVRALSGVNADFQAGEIHAVLGENGAGKSTLMGIIAGFVVPDEGELRWKGDVLTSGQPYAAKQTGITMVHQHFTLVPGFSVAENLALACHPALAGDSKPARDAADSLKRAEELGWKFDPSARTSQLPVGVQQRIEIIKALSGNAELLIFDEPTAVLAPDEVEDLFRVLRELKGQGKAIVLIAHKLSEVLAIADRVTVLRRGEFVATALRGEVDETRLAEWMVGELPVRRDPDAHREFPPGLSVHNLWVKGDRGEPSIRDVSFEVGRGEILGIGGVDGNGQVELAEALARVRRVASGSIFVHDVDPDEVRIAYIPQDRQADGLALSMSIRDNLLLGGLHRADLSCGPVWKPGAVRRWTASLIERFEVKIGHASDPASSLSGGNQQKIVVARSLDRTPDLLIAVNPTRGLDVRATDYVHTQIIQAAAAGARVALISTDLDELAALAHRTLFLSRGELREGGASALVGGRA